MSCPESEEIDAAPPPGFSTPTKAICNDGTGHAGPDAVGTEANSDRDVEKQFDESTGRSAIMLGPILTDLSRSGSGPLDLELY